MGVRPGMACRRERLHGVGPQSRNLIVGQATNGKNLRRVAIANGVKTKPGCDSRTIKLLALIRAQCTNLRQRQNADLMRRQCQELVIAKFIESFRVHPDELRDTQRGHRRNRQVMQLRVLQMIENGVSPIFNIVVAQLDCRESGIRQFMQLRRAQGIELHLCQGTYLRRRQSAQNSQLRTAGQAGQHRGFQGRDLGVGQGLEQRGRAADGGQHGG